MCCEINPVIASLKPLQQNGAHMEHYLYVDGHLAFRKKRDTI